MARKLILLLICCLLLSQAGCGGLQGDAAKGDKPWDLFTEKEAEAVLGFEVEPEIQKIDPMGQRIVFYGGVAEKETDFIQISVIRDEEMEESLKEQGDNVKQLFEETKSTLSNSPSPVKGFGDEAFWNSGALHILAGSIYVTISTSHSDSPESLARAKEIAETVMSRI